MTHYALLFRLGTLYIIMIKVESDYLYSSGFKLMVDLVAVFILLLVYVL